MAAQNAGDVSMEGKELNTTDGKSDLNQVLRYIDEKFKSLQVKKEKPSAQIPQSRLTELIKNLDDKGTKPKMHTPFRDTVDSNQHPSFLTSTPVVSRPMNSYSQSLPKIPCFSGDEPIPKGEVTYMVWKYEVQCIKSNPELSQVQILQVVRGSLRGTARIMVIPLGQNASLDEILAKLDVMFADAASQEDLIAEFFNSNQKPSESVTAFACRLETLLQSIISKGQLPCLAKNDLLRHKFWTGLQSESLKLNTRHKYDSVMDYNLLLKEVRKVEKELSNTYMTMPQSQLSFKGISNSAEAKQVRHTPLAAESSVDTRFTSLEKKMVELEQHLDRKIDQKFDQILARLDASQPLNHDPSFPFQSHNRGRGRGQQNNRNPRYYNNHSNNNRASNY